MSEYDEASSTDIFQFDEADDFHSCPRVVRVGPPGDCKRHGLAKLRILLEVRDSNGEVPHYTRVLHGAPFSGEEKKCQPNVRDDPSNNGWSIGPEDCQGVSSGVPASGGRDSPIDCTLDRRSDAETDVCDLTGGLHGDREEFLGATVRDMAWPEFLHEAHSARGRDSMVLWLPRGRMSRTRRFRGRSSTPAPVINLVGSLQVNSSSQGGNNLSQVEHSNHNFERGSGYVVPIPGYGSTDQKTYSRLQRERAVVHPDNPFQNALQRDGSVPVATAAFSRWGADSEESQISGLHHANEPGNGTGPWFL